MNHTQNTPKTFPAIDPIRRPKLAAEIMGISVATYYRLVNAGKLKHVKVSNRTGGTPQSSIDEHLKNCEA